MKILIMYKSRFNPQRGGIERVSDLLCREFTHRGHNVVYLHVERSESAPPFTAPVKEHFFPVERKSNATEPATNIEFFDTLLRQELFDIVINQDPLDFCHLFSKASIPERTHVVTVLHSNPLYDYKQLKHKILQPYNDSLIEKFKRYARIVKVPQRKTTFLNTLRQAYDEAMRYSDAFCLLSMGFIDELKMACSHVDESKVTAIGNPNTYDNAETGVSVEKKKQLLYVGRVTRAQKRVDKLVKAWKMIHKDFPEWELVIVGDGPLRKELETTAANAGRVKFTGWQDPREHYKAASILCLTSSYEGWGMAITEGMTYGAVPVVFDTYAAASDIIDNGVTGVLVKPYSTRRYATALRKLMSDDVRRSKMSKAAREAVKRFDIARIADEWEKLFRACCGEEGD